MKALARSINNNCEKDRPVWLSDIDVLQEEKRDDFDFLAKQKKCDPFYLWQWPDPKIEIRRLGGHSTYGKSFVNQIEMTFQEDEYVNLEKNGEDQFTVSKKKFKELIPILLKDYREKYLAVIGNNPYEIGEDEDELFDLVTEKYGDVQMCIGKIIETQEVQTDLTLPKFAIINDD